MKSEERKAAVAEYKKRKVASGIFALRCSADGQIWVGRAPDVSKIENRLWFTLERGASINRTLQASWQQHGRKAFAIEIVEHLEEESDPYLRESVAKERLAFWRASLSASAF
ncbi:GIY-YIG nuclease family protein [Consotaella salsifontis]|uniref:GIY-YIG nuclease family protein n=1 Tax=Consotaella salsifontis TaxID=1365950 RepID=A0A1T4RA37_9HYPH|nr:GIY-YIG nuclease family protein [Consotaella salsifontis]SKA12481.1 hypothetical protein SAMN05428963_106131 [Consotaella salsifontis]